MKRRSAAAAVGVGALAGVVGGAVVMALSMLFMIARGGDAWQAMKLASHPFAGHDAFLAGFDVGTVVLGLAVHHAVSAFWGILFALLFRGIPLFATLVAGIAWGPIVWVNMYYLVLPAIDAEEIARIAPVPLAVLEHLLFTLTIALVMMPFQKMLARLEAESIARRSSSFRQRRTA